MMLLVTGAYGTSSFRYDLCLAPQPLCGSRFIKATAYRRSEVTQTGQTTMSPEGRHSGEKGNVMATTALKKASSKRGKHPAKKVAAAEPEVKRKLNRVGTLVNASLDTPMTIGER
jgi:hypothetical protein